MTKPIHFLPKWVRARHGEAYLDALIQEHLEGTFVADKALEREISLSLFALRFQRAIEPWCRIFRLAWEICRGKYWRAAKKVHSGSDQTSGTSTGASGASFTFTGNAGVAPTNTGPGYFSSTGVGWPSATQAQILPLPPLLKFDDAGIKAGEVTAYRCWKIGDDGLLRSVVYDDFVWKPGEIAVGEPTLNMAGIYAYKSILLLHHYGSVENKSVTGTVDLWGDVYEHEHGYRAQYAAVSSIDDSPYYDADALRKLYGLKRKKKTRK